MAPDTLQPGWEHVVDAAREVAAALSARGGAMACAESCTGGLVAAAATALPGSSAWFDRGWVTYSNQAKTEMLGVDPELLVAHGAVSRAVVLAMARGAAERAPVHATLAISGIAGPGGGSADKPVGLVWFAWAWRAPEGLRLDAESMRWDGDRAAIRLAAARHALAGLARRVAG